MRAAAETNRPYQVFEGKIAVVVKALLDNEVVLTRTGYTGVTQTSESKRPTPKDWPNRLLLLVGPHGLEPWTKGL